MLILYHDQITEYKVQSAIQDDETWLTETDVVTSPSSMVVGKRQLTPQYDVDRYRAKKNKGRKPSYQ